MSMLISDSFAAVASTSAAPAQGDGLYSMFMIAAIFVLMYVMMIRPQNKRAKEHRDLVAKLQKGDEVITNGGILGKVLSLDEQYIKIQVSEGVDIAFQRGAISAVLPKGTLKSLLA